jgi:hypothetical protein
MASPDNLLCFLALLSLSHSSAHSFSQSIIIHHSTQSPPSQSAPHIPPPPARESPPAPASDAARAPCSRSAARPRAPVAAHGHEERARDPGARPILRRHPQYRFCRDATLKRIPGVGLLRGRCTFEEPANAGVCAAAEQSHFSPFELPNKRRLM